MDWISVLAIIIGIIGSLIGGLVAQRLSKLQRKSLTQSRNAWKKAQQELRNKMVHDLAMNIEDRQTKDLILKEFIVHLESSASNDIAVAQQDSIKREVEDRTTVLKERLENIEKKFPEESTLEKVASVNDAILGTKIEELQRSIERIESKLFSKWDIAKIVFTIIGSLGALVGLTITVIKFVAIGITSP
ncbi:hypothetical protein KAU11_12060 [Candidatus Babeliales bacterium]|nr:hypothetical protein [Candidatus Babeliales bacterium]